MIKKILVFGDSIAFGSNDWVVGGWVVRLKNYFAKTGQFCHVFNLAISGEDSSQIVARIEGEIFPRKSTEPEKKALLLVGIPINDTRIINNIEGGPEIDKIKFLENISKIHQIGDRNIDEIVFVGMTGVDEEKANPWQAVVERRIVCWRNDIIEEYNEIAKDYCKQNGLHFIDMLDVLEKTDLPDGLHPNEIGHKKMFVRIKEFLIKQNLIQSM